MCHLQARRRKEKTHPQKIKVMEKKSWAMFPAVSAVSIPATIRLVKVDVKSKNAQMKRNIRPLRSVIAPVGSAFRYNPIG